MSTPVTQTRHAPDCDGWGSVVGGPLGNACEGECARRTAAFKPLQPWPGTFQRPNGAWRWLCAMKTHGFLLMPSYSLAYIDSGEVTR